MKVTGSIAGYLLVLIGTVWALLGLNVLGGSFMTGQFQWLVIGIAVAIIGIALLFWMNRQRRPDLERVAPFSSRRMARQRVDEDGCAPKLFLVFSGQATGIKDYKNEI